MGHLSWLFFGGLLPCVDHSGIVPVYIPLQNVAALKQLMEEVATLKAEREVVVKELKDPISDISELAVW